MKQSREAKYASVRAILEDNIKLRNRAEDRFQNFFEKEINQLKNDLQTEREVPFLNIILAF